MLKTQNNNLKSKLLFVFLGIIFTIVVFEIIIRSFVNTYSMSIKHYDLLNNNVIRVLCLGESTTFLGGKYSWPRQLENILNSFSLNSKFEVVNGGVPRTNTNKILRKLNNNLDKYKPQIVVMMAGCNDDGVQYEKKFIDKNLFLFNNCVFYRLTSSIIQQSLRRFYIAINKNNFINLGDFFYREEEFQKAEEFYLKAYNKNPANFFVLHRLAYFYGNLDRKNEARYYSDIIRSLYPNSFYSVSKMYRMEEIDFNDHNLIKNEEYLAYALIHMGNFYYKHDKIKEAIVCYKKVIDINEKLGSKILNISIVYSNLGMIYKDMNNVFLANAYFSKATKCDFLRAWKSRYHLNNTTKTNYIKIKKILDFNKVKLVCMQYPNRSIDLLKDIFKNNTSEKEVIYVSNEENFRVASKKWGSSKLFEDFFAIDFGHCTPFGNRLIAENVAKTLMDNFNFK